ncbi:3-carboxy-cis,cis-muconate cycloisomerase [Cupriavidus sp. OV038]|jgi:adenylosuccinate lyase|uniref:adenylosuccinate lyase n=1 Tax=unclassified Cupriavidus TaxID=2640874 RepID=UPI0008EAC331|nr:MULTISPECIES: adenylosuccinate lyase [unclassified Cupriavidus]SFC43792.1 3-carboxy-cis,cis-muconate cycloisomerase [Cupriavidus sp. OV038]SFP32534.1 3-carboxy-cis,cis-muconate cycloisomerase [Cupriavidus sp. OV096]
MAAYVIDSALFRDQFSTAQMREIFSDETTVQRWLDVEAALAKVQARLGIIPQRAADEICAKARVELIDLPDLKREMDRTSHPIVPLLRAMKKVCSGDAAEYIHWGATTQDIIDTGTMLQVRDALEVIGTRYAELEGHLVKLAQTHRDLTMVARSHGQQALPITFGFKAAVWVEEMRRNQERFAAMKQRVLVGQFSGAVGTLAALGDKGIAVQEALFEELGLGCPRIHWHVSRDSIAELACVLAICTGTIGKIAHEVYSLQKTETAELEEPFSMGKVGSSTMPHKRNPPTCETVVALARLVRNTAPMALESIMAEHERDKIVLQTEREFISRLCCMSDAAALKLGYVCANLTVRPANMEKNLFIQRGLLMSEAVMMGLSDRLGRQEAHEIVYEVCMDVFERGGDFREALLANPKVAAGIDAQTIDKMLDPHGYTGMAGFFVDRVVGQQAR